MVVPFEDIYLVTDRLNRIPPNELDAFEQRLGFPLPFGYREYMSFFGTGKFCQNLKVLTPAQIEPDLEYWRHEYVPIAIEQEFWADNLLLNPIEMATAVVFAKTLQGDEFVSCPSKGQVIFELPRHESRMRLLSDGFLKPFDIPQAARDRFCFPFFEAHNDRHCMTQMILNARADAREVWKVVQDRWGATMRVAEGDLSSVDHTVVFIKAIQGAVTLESGHSTPWFYFEYDMDYSKEVLGVIKTPTHLVEARGGNWPRD